MKPPRQRHHQNCSRVDPIRHVQEWCKDKPPFLRIMVKWMIYAPGDIHWGLEMNRKREWPEEFPVPENPKEWLRMYTRSRSMLDYIHAVMFHGDRQLMMRLGVFQGMAQYLAHTPRDVLISELQTMTEQEWRWYWARMTFYYKDTEERLDQWIGRMLDEERPPSQVVMDALKSPIFQFYMRVWGPCIHIYGVRPSVLLWQARKGDVGACEKLIQLDPTIMQDRRVAKVMHNCVHGPKKEVHRMLTEAALKPPYGEVSMTTHKARVGAFLIYVAKVCRYKLHAGQLRKLFNAAARDMNPKRRVLIDHGIANLGEGFRKAIQRGHEFWKPILPALPEAVPVNAKPTERGGGPGSK